MLFLRALGAFLVLPCIVGGLIPLALIRLDPWRVDGHGIGYATLGLGAGILLRCVWDFYTTGRGTLAHWAPPRHLVTVGFYRHTRNPMYVGVLTILVSHALLFGSPLLALYSVGVAMLFQWHIVRREEPWLARQFPGDWERYRREVPRWFIRSRRGRE